MLDALDVASRRATLWVALIAVAAMIALSLGTVADVLGRAVLNRPIPGFGEVAELAIAVLISFCFPCVLATRRNLTVDFLAGIFTPGQRAALAAVGGALTVLFVSTIAWRFWIHADGLSARNAQTATLLLPQAPFWWTIAAVLLACLPVQVIATLVQFRNALQFGAQSLNPEAMVGAATIPQGSRMPLVVAISAVGLLSVTALAWPNDALPANLAFLREGPVIAVLAFVALFAGLLLQLPLGPAMAMAGLAATTALLGSPDPGLFTLATNSATLLASLDLAAIPLFLMMGSFAAAAGVSDDLFRFAQATLGRFRGGLALATIGGCAGFGAVTGSSVACAASMGRVALPEMRKRGYSIELAAGSVAAGGTLGILIPPSSIMIVYCVLASASVGQMYVAAMIPATLGVLLYMAVVLIRVRVDPNAAPAGERTSMSEVAHAMIGCWSMFLLFGVVIGGLYLGIFTATEAAAVGAGAAFLFAWARGRLGNGRFWHVLEETASAAGMLYFLVLGAAAFAFYIGVSRLPTAIFEFVQTMDVAPILVIACILLVYLVLGCFMDPYTTLFVTVPIVLPIVTGLGYDVIWWGILTVMLIEIGMITPPFGLNVFVIKSVAEDLPLSRAFRGVLPFIGADVVRVGLLLAFPIIALWLPSAMK